MKRWLIMAAMVAGLMGTAHAEIRVRTQRLFSASTDSTEQASPWIEVGNARRVILRTYSNKAAFHASTDADSAFSDTITVFKVVFTDSLSRSNPPTAADSVVLTTATVATTDTTTKMVAVFHPPLQEALRAPGNGSGIITLVLPMSPSTTAGVPGLGGELAPRYMRVLITPLRRNTVTGGNSTAGKRVNGLKSLRMTATIISEER